MDPDIGWDISKHPLPDVPNHGRGRDVLMADMIVTYLSGWTDYSAELKEVINAGDQVVVVLHETARMRDTGVPLIATWCRSGPCATDGRASSGSYARR